MMQGGRIARLYAFLANHPTGEEGLMGIPVANGSMMPMVASDRERMESLLETAQMAATHSGLEVTIAEFLVRRDERLLTPGGSLLEFIPPEAQRFGAMSAYDREHVGDLLVRPDANWFTVSLLRLCAKSDVDHLERLRLGFPEEVEAYERWRAAPPADGSPRE